MKIKNLVRECVLNEKDKTFLVQVGSPQKAKTVKIQAKSKADAYRKAVKEYEYGGDRVNKHSIVEEGVKDDDMYNDKEFMKFIKDTSKMTQHNDHNNAYIQASAFMFNKTKKRGYKNLMEIFKHIGEIAKIEGEMPHHLLDYRYVQYKKLMKWAEQDLGKEAFRQFYKVF